jgi:hypothetical protein
MGQWALKKNWLPHKTGAGGHKKGKSEKQARINFYERDIVCQPSGLAATAFPSLTTPYLSLLQAGKPAHFFW